MVGAVSRADLVRAYAAHGEDGLAAMARLLGYRDTPVERLPVPSPTPIGEAVDVAVDVVPVTASDMAPLPFWRPEVVEKVDDEERRSESVAPQVKPLDLDELAPELDEAPAPAPIVPWSRLWPALDRALRSTIPSREVDTAALVESWSRGRPVPKVPRLEAQTWSRRVTVLVDRERRLIPFWSDQDELCRRLRRRIGEHGVRIAQGNAGASGAWRSEDTSVYRGTVIRRLARGGTVDGETFLVLGDLGFYASRRSRAAWGRMARSLRRDGVRTRALVPCPASRWTPRLSRLWNAVDWSSPLGSHAAPSPDADVLEARCERLLALLSPALRVEPGLLRAIRHLLPAQEADAGTEADVWSHPAVDGASSSALCMASGRDAETPSAERLAAFRREPKALRRAVMEEIRRWHAALPREVWYEEALTLAAVGGDVLSEDDVEEALTFLARLNRRLEEPSAKPLRRYSRELVGRRSEESWEHGRMGSLLQRIYLNVRRYRPDLPLPPGLSPTDLDDAEAGPPGRWTVWQVGSKLSSLPEGERSEQGSPLVTFGAARPVVAVASGRGAWQELHRLESDALELPWTSGVFLGTDLERVEIRRLLRPSWANAAGRDRFGLWADVEVRGVVQRFRWIAPGRFLMGSPEEEEGRWNDEGPQHQVTLTQGYWLADTPCTQAFWEAVTGRNPSRFQDASPTSLQRPVEQVSWEDCEAFIQELNRRVPGLDAGLPTEAEWEYACRAGTTTSRYTDDPKEIAWYWENSSGESHPVAQKLCNPWGVHDMLGNAWEWCADYWRDSYDPAEVVDPQRPPKGSRRVVRGGSWINNARYVRSACRVGHPPGDRNDYVGFRLARGQHPARQKEEAGLA